MLGIFEDWRSIRRYAGYLPQPVTYWRFRTWLRQFKKEDRKLIKRLLGSVIYLSDEDVKRILIEQNAALMRRLGGAGLRPKDLIYLQVHDAGSSSPVMLNLLRDSFGLEQRGCHFLDANNTLGLHEKTNKIEQGALIYVDDFVGTGRQFCEARDFAAKFIEIGRASCRERV